MAVTEPVVVSGYEGSTTTGSESPHDPIPTTPPKGRIVTQAYEQWHNPPTPQIPGRLVFRPKRVKRKPVFS